MAKLEMLFSRQEIDTAVNRLAEEISRDFRDKNPLVLGVLKGSFIFLADLGKTVVGNSQIGAESGRLEVWQDLTAAALRFGAQVAVETLVREVSSFAGSVPRMDDITMIVIEKR